MSYADLVAQKERLKGQQPYQQGYMMMWLKVNNTLVPAQIQLYGKNLYCQWISEPGARDQQQFNATNCMKLQRLDFGSAQAGVPLLQAL